MVRKIDSKSARSALPARREPYWSRVATGLHVGYRKPQSGEGTWIARKRLEDGQQKYHALGTFDDEGGKAYDKATRAAQAWARKVDQGVEVGGTVEDACKAYVNYLEQQKGKAAKDDAEGRFKRLVYNKTIGRIQLDKLKSTQVREWLNKQIPDDEEDPEKLRRAKDSANRNLSALKAALNRALKDRLVDTDAGWRTVERFRDAGKRRDRFLTKQERQAIIAAAPKDLAVFIRGLLLTLARPGELARATVADFDSRHGILMLSGKTGPRTVTLSTAAVKFFRRQSKDKLPSAPLLTQADGKRWNKEDWKKPFKEAVQSAGLPDEIVLYHIRHAAISEAMAAGIDSFVVAKLAGTSTAMIDRHYGHLRHDVTRARLDAMGEL